MYLRISGRDVGTLRREEGGERRKENEKQNYRIYIYLYTPLYIYVCRLESRRDGRDKDRYLYMQGKVRLR